IECVLADMAERRVAAAVAEPESLHQILSQPQRSGHRPRDLGALERVGHAGLVVVSAWGDEHLGLVLQTPERLAVHDPITVALERRAQSAVRFGLEAIGRVRPRGLRREVALLTLLDPVGERGRYIALRMLISGARELIGHGNDSD